MGINTNHFIARSGASKGSTPIYLITKDIWEDKNKLTGSFAGGLAKSQGFEGKPGQTLIVPNPQTGKTKAVFLGIDSKDNMWALSNLAASQRDGKYHINDQEMKLSKDQAYKMSLGWALARYRFEIKNGKFNSDPKEGATLVLPGSVDKKYEELVAEIEATWLVRDLINKPANILNTNELSQETISLAKMFNVSASDIVDITGPALEEQFPLIHTVGKASENEPHLTYFSWSGSNAKEDAPKVLLVGKGVTFDTGGLDLKTAASMKGMKKDMGGAAHVLGLSHMIMSNDLPIHLHVMTPIAENSVNANAFRPSDVITARDGTGVFIGNTDAEGRLIMADALSYGSETWDPDLIIDFATLTGAQRIADGTDVGAIFTNDIKAGRELEDLGEQWNDDLKHHKMFEKHHVHLKPPPADGGDVSSSCPGPGAEMAAWFLRHFTRAANKATWIHYDINGANVSSSPGRPKGGEAMGMRAAYRFIKNQL